MTRLMSPGADQVPRRGKPRNSDRLVNAAPTRHIAVAVLLSSVLVLSSAGSDAPPAQPTVHSASPASMIPPPGVPRGRYGAVPSSAEGPPIDPAKGYRVEPLGAGLFMITDNVYQSMFMVYETGVVVVDAPPSYAAHIGQAVREVTDRPITHLIYSHSHADHVGGAASLGGRPIIISQRETLRLLARVKDPARPLPTRTFADRYVLKAGSQRLELSYHGVAHSPGNIFIYAPKQRVLMAVDLVSPGWMPFRRFSIAQDIPGYFAQVGLIDQLPFEKLVGGHVARTGTHLDVKTQIAFMEDVKSAAAHALANTAFGEGLDPADGANPWAGASEYIDRVAGSCVAELAPKWQARLGGFDVFVWDQCYAMQQSLSFGDG